MSESGCEGEEGGEEDGGEGGGDKDAGVGEGAGVSESWGAESIAAGTTADRTCSCLRSPNKRLQRRNLRLQSRDGTLRMFGWIWVLRW